MILNEIVMKTIKRVENQKSTVSLLEIISKAENTKNNNISFYDSLSKSYKNNGIAFICEVKKASPSKGVISEEFDYLNIAMEYQNAGAAAISVLTEPYFFKGKNEYLVEIKKITDVPLLRKDFVVDEYQVYEAKAIHADAILLICSVLNDIKLKSFIELATKLELDALVEAHDKKEIERAIACGARIIGVNNRNLKDFTVNISNSINLRKYVPNDILFVSESGISTHEDIKELINNNTTAVLIGETFMKAENKTEKLNKLLFGE